MKKSNFPLRSFASSLIVVVTVTKETNNACGCTNTAKFENPQKDLSFGNHVIANHSVQSTTECLWKCLANQQCLSLNYAHASSNGHHLCELNSQTKFSKPSDYSSRPGFTYYGPDTVKQHIGKCIRIQDCGSQANSDENGVTCECRKDYTGEKCDIHSGVKSCKDLKKLGAPNGVYNINPDNLGIITVYCDQTTDGGGWTVFHRRLSPFSLNFNRGWVEYQNGFGHVDGEFWLGNDNIHRLTAAATKEFRIDLTASGSHHGYAKFLNFQVASSSDKYRWTMNSYSGNIGNSIYGYSSASWNQNNRRFSAPDQDNDHYPYGRCASNSGWWMNWCGHSNLHNIARPHWNSWSYKTTVIKSMMMLR